MMGSNTQPSSLHTLACLTGCRFRGRGVRCRAGVADRGAGGAVAGADRASGRADQRGAGKTEVYLRAIQTALESGGGVILLVPEVALTPQRSEERRVGKECRSRWS